MPKEAKLRTTNKTFNNMIEYNIHKIYPKKKI